MLHAMKVARITKSELVRRLGEAEHEFARRRRQHADRMKRYRNKLAKSKRAKAKAGDGK